MKILVAADGSGHSSEAIELLKRLGLADHADVEIATVLEDFYGPTDSTLIRDRVRELVRDRQNQTAADLAREVTARLGCSHAGSVVLDGHVADVLLNRAAQTGADLIVAGARGLSALEHFVLGSTTEKLLKHAPCSVLVSQPVDPGESTVVTTLSAGTSDEEPPSDRVRILVAYDGSPASDAAVDLLAREGARRPFDITLVTVLTVVSAYRMDVLQHLSHEWANELKHARQAVGQAADRLRSAGCASVETRVEEADDIADCLLRIAIGRHADVIMVGDSGRSRFDRFLLGSVASRIIRHAECGVWLVREASDGSASRG